MQVTLHWLHLPLLIRGKFGLAVVVVSFGCVWSVRFFEIDSWNYCIPKKERQRVINKIKTQLNKQVRSKTIRAHGRTHTYFAPISIGAIGPHSAVKILVLRKDIRCWTHLWSGTRKEKKRKNCHQNKMPNFRLSFEIFQQIIIKPKILRFKKNELCANVLIRK